MEKIKGGEGVFFRGGPKKKTTDSKLTNYQVRGKNPEVGKKDVHEPQMTAKRGQSSMLDKRNRFREKDRGDAEKAGFPGVA